jgi:hypothetical protein
MNKFLEKLLCFKTGQRIIVKSPIMRGFELNEQVLNGEYGSMRYKFSLSFSQECFVNEHDSNNPYALDEMRKLLIKRLHYEVYGDIDSYMNELLYHLHNHDFERCIETVQLIKNALEVPV